MSSIARKLFHLCFRAPFLEPGALPFFLGSGSSSTTIYQANSCDVTSFTAWQKRTNIGLSPSLNFASPAEDLEARFDAGAFVVLIDVSRAWRIF
ncbi:hypothetical protein GALMADRAFT_143998 [Galerina marginata CBS 339.88]|uniref:Uncharacterized protein n=1 Tax=Galerina marginata (strain CBS 339.88) TaxID=685588 RepID=A0A067SK30_GALM3|nr:hypothetical protein GALMADRAFT_143998 [Galerina marginata CBS 339.88]